MRTNDYNVLNRIAKRYHMERTKGLEGLRRVREEKNLSQQALAMKLGVARNTVCQWESGTRSPSISMLKLISEKLNCSIEQIL